MATRTRESLGSYAVGSVPATAGIGPRHPHVPHFLDSKPNIDWIEVHSENYLADGGPRLGALEAIRQDYPLSCHGVGLSLGSHEGIGAAHLERLKTLFACFEPDLVSEHVSWSVTDGVYLILGACADFDGRPKQTLGALLGGGLGALAGSQFGSGSGQLAAVAIGTLGGAFLGSEIGQSLDRANQSFMRQTSELALERNRPGVASAWRNPDTGHAGTVIPTRTYQTAQGDPCREFQQTVTIGGKTETAYGTSCRQADGSWRIVN